LGKPSKWIVGGFRRWKIDRFVVVFFDRSHSSACQRLAPRNKHAENTKWCLQTESLGSTPVFRLKMRTNPAADDHAAGPAIFRLL
jgi:hypothetical protein